LKAEKFLARFDSFNVIGFKQFHKKSVNDKLMFIVCFDVSAVELLCLLYDVLLQFIVSVWILYMYMLINWLTCLFRFSELPTDAGWKHVYRQHHHLHRRLPATASGNIVNQT